MKTSSQLTQAKYRRSVSPVGLEFEEPGLDVLGPVLSSRIA